MRKLAGYVAMTLILLASCGGEKKAAPDPAPVQYEIFDLTAEAEHWADSVCSSMTLRQKVAQMFLPAVYASSDYWTVRQVRQYADSCVGGVVLLKGNVPQAEALVDSMRRGAPIAPFVAIDAEWGLAMRLADAPEFPSNHEISKSADEQLMYDYGREVARECRAIGISMVLGPVVDVSGPDSFMLRRSFGDDPRRVADLALAYARGLEDGDVISVAKHFPGHGSVSVDSHRRKGVIDRSLNEMDSTDLYPFRKWIEQRLSGIMVGHLAVPSIDSKMLPAAVSPVVITDLLRNDLGFTGLVITDAINMKGAEGYGSVDAVRAGADMIIAPENTFADIDRVAQAVVSGVVKEEEIDSRVRRILFYKYLFGLGGSGVQHGHSEDSRVGPVQSARADSISERLLR